VKKKALPHTQYNQEHSTSYNNNNNNNGSIANSLYLDQPKLSVLPVNPARAHLRRAQVVAGEAHGLKGKAVRHRGNLARVEERPAE